MGGIQRERVLSGIEKIKREGVPLYDYESYVTKISFQYSCNMCIIQIGELVSRLSDELLDTHTEIPWYAIKGMRNLHAHDYERVNYKTVWNTLQKEIPELKNQLEQILDKE